MFTFLKWLQPNAHHCARAISRVSPISVKEAKKSFELPFGSKENCSEIFKHESKQMKSSILIKQILISFNK